MFSVYLVRWNLIPDGEAIITSTSQLLPVRLGSGVPAMLKIAVVEEEQRAGQLMRWWAGQGAACVLAHDDAALLLERAQDGPLLSDFPRNGRDDEASRIICAVVASLHAHRSPPPPGLVPLARWFEPLMLAGTARGGMLRLASSTAAALLTMPQEVRALHGDIHHGNILHFGSRGWLAIDPKGLLGERALDYANLFCNPDQATATKPGRLARQIEVVATAAQLEPGRLLAWVLAWAGLSATFLLEDSLPPDDALRVADLAAAEMNR